MHRYGLENAVKGFNLKFNNESKQKVVKNRRQRNKKKVIGSFCYDPMTDSKKKSNRQMLQNQESSDLNSIASTEQKSLRSSVGCDTNRSIKEQIRSLARQSHDFSIYHDRR